MSADGLVPPRPQALGPTHQPAQLPKLWPASLPQSSPRLACPSTGPKSAPWPPSPPSGAVTHRRRAPRGEKNGSVRPGPAPSRPALAGARLSFLTFLDHRLVQKAHSRVIHGLRTGEAVVRALVDLASFRFPSPAVPAPCPACSLSSCSGRRALRSGGLGWVQGSQRLGTIWAVGTSP